MSTETTTTIPPNLPKNKEGEEQLGYVNANNYQISFSLRTGANVSLGPNEQVIDEASGQRVKYHVELEGRVRTGDLKRLYPADLKPKPKAAPSRRALNAAKSNEETHQRLTSDGKFRPEGLPTTYVSTERGPETRENTQSPTSRPATQAEMEAEPANVAVVRAADRATMPAKVTESVANTVSSVVFTDDNGLPLTAQKQDGGGFVFEGKTYTSIKALQRILKSGGREIRVQDLADSDPSAE